MKHIKKIISIILCLTIILIPLSSSLVSFAQGTQTATHAQYHYINTAFADRDSGSIFALYDNEVSSFDEAKRICEDLGGHLATISSQEEENAIVKMVSEITTTRAGFYIGVYDPDSNGNFMTIDGVDLSSPGSFSAWGSGEPNNIGTETAAEFYVSTGKWNNDKPTAANRGFICEFEASDIPAERMTYNGHEYLLFNESLSWNEAKTACENLGGHLVTIIDEAENQAVTEFACGNLHPNYWIGLRGISNNDDEGFENDYWIWSWVKYEDNILEFLSSDIEYRPWDFSEMSGASDSTYGWQKYAHIFTDHTLSASHVGKWHNTFNFYLSSDGYNLYETSKFGYICEFDQKFLSFDSNGGTFRNGSTVVTKELFSGDRLGIIETPQRPGYTFAGWFDAAAGGNQKSFYNCDYNNASSGTYYAHWNANKYTVKFNQRGCKVTKDVNLGKTEVTYGSPYGYLPVPQSNNPDLVFDYWKDSDGNRIYENTVVTISDNHTLYPQWKEKTSENNITDIIISKLPDKVDYAPDETFDPTGMELTAVYDDSATRKINIADCTFENTQFNTLGEHEVSISYQSLQIKLIVSVSYGETEDVIIEALPKKTNYAIHESLDVTGLKLAVKYEKSNEYIIIEDGYTVENRVFDTPGKYYITVSYGGLDTQFTVNVNKPTVQSIDTELAADYTVYQNDTGIDLNYLRIYAVFSDGSRVLLDTDSVYERMVYDFSECGLTNVTVTLRYEGTLFTSAFTVNVNERPQAEEVSSIYSDDNIEGLASELISVPVYIDCKTPVLGFGMRIDYDKDILKPYGIIYSDTFTQSANLTVNDSIGGSITDYVLVNAVSKNGNLSEYSGKVCDILFFAGVNDTAETTVSLKMNEKDTFGDNYQSVRFESFDVNIRIKKSDHTYSDTSNSIYSDDVIFVNDDSEAEVPIYLNNKSNLSGCRLTIEYDKNELEAYSLRKGELLNYFTDSKFAFNIIQDQGKILIVFFGDEAIESEGILLFITFKAYNMTSGYSNISITVDDAVNDTNKNIVFTGKSFSIADGLLFARNNTGVTVDDQFVYGFTDTSKPLSDYVFTLEGFELSYDTSMRIGTNLCIDVRKSGKTLAKYYVIVFGDVNGDGYYDGQDALIVNCIANGMLDREQVGEAKWMAADCNHDGEINATDVAILEQAGLLFVNVDQTMSQDELMQSDSYIEYLNLIDQNPAGEEPNAEEPTDPDPTPQTFLVKLIEILQKVITFIRSLFPKI